MALSDWKRIGPFTAGNFDEAAKRSSMEGGEPEKGTRRASGWTRRIMWTARCTHLLAETARAILPRPVRHRPAARAVTGSDDSFRIWLNGQLVADKKISRGVAPDQDKVTLNLKPGENQLLFKIANGSGGYGFYFKANQVTLPPAVLAALKVESGKRTAAQKNAVTAHYRTPA